MLTIKNWRDGARHLASGLVLILALVGCTPAGPRALLDGQNLLRQGKYVKAIARLQKAVQLLPSNAQAWNHLGLAYHRAGQLDAALQAYERARRCDLNLTPIRYNLGCLFLDRNEPQAAVSELTTYTLLQRDSVDGWVKLGTAQLRSRQWDGAERSFVNALHLRDDLAEAWNGLGVSQVQRRRAHEARNSFSQALQKQPNYAPALLNLAVLEQRTFNSPAQALQYYREYLRIEPGSREAGVVQENVRALQEELAPPPRPAPVVAAVPQAANRAPLPTNPAPRASEATMVSLSRPVTSSSTTVVPPPNASAGASQPVTNLSRTAPTKLVSAAEHLSPSARSEPPPPLAKPEPKLEAKLEPRSFTEVKPAPAVTHAVATLTPAANSNLVASGNNRPVLAKVTGSVEVVRIPTEPAPRVAHDAAAFAKTQQVAMATPATLDEASAMLNRKIQEMPSEPPPPQKTRVIDRLNPVTWFRPKRRASASRSDVEPLPAMDASASSSASASAKDSPEETPSASPLAPLKHYAYRSPEKPLGGDRAKADPLFAEAVQAHRDGRLPDAIQSYQKAIRQDPSFFEAHYNLGLAAYEQRDYARSLSAYESALSINPTSVNARYNFALALQQSGYYQDAANELEKLLRQNPDEGRAHLALATLYAEKLGEPAAARPHYRRLLELDPQHPQAPAIRYWLAANP